MRALAEYVMRGRSQAVMAAVLATGTVFFAWVGAAVIALVILRKGPAQGSRILAWTMLPALVLVLVGDTGPVTTLLGTTLAATVLRMTASWPYSLVAAVVSGLVTGLLMLTAGRAYIDEIIRVLGEALSQVASQQAPHGVVQIATPDAMQVAALLGLGNALTVIVCLLLARWWQAMLYNPGGFRAEFHSLKLSPPLAVALLAIGLTVSSLGGGYRLWALLFALPFVFSGLALIHGLAARKGLGSGWLGLFYFFLVLLDPLKAGLIVMAVADSWLDFRGRLDRRSSPGGS